MISPIIRPVTPNDTDALTKIYNYYILHDHCTFETDPLTPDTMQKRVEVMSIKYPYLVLEHNNAVEGFIYAGPYRDRKAYDCTAQISVYIAINSTGKGYGKLLMKELIEKTKDYNFYSLVSIIAEPNEHSILLHKKFGFALCGKMKSAGFKFGKYFDTTIMQLILQRETGKERF